MVTLRTLFVTALLFVSVASAGAAAPVTQPDAQTTYNELLTATAIPAGWTGRVDGCVAGSESVASRDATLRALNLIRGWAGVGSVAFRDDLNRKALAAALMMQAQGGLSHEPRPGYACYTEEGAQGAAGSNLLQGGSGAGAILSYLEDSGVDNIGHRRWILDPRGQTFGTGSTGEYNALYVTEPPSVADAPVPELVAWPPGTYVPWQMVYEDWTAAIGLSGRVDVSRSTVTVLEGDRPRSTSGLRVLPDDAGTGTTLAWKVDIPEADRTVNRDLRVRIGNVVVDDVSRTLEYTVRAFPSSTLPVPAAPVPTVTPTAMPTADGGAPNLARAMLRRQRVVRKGKRLIVRMRIARAADGDRLRIAVRGGKRQKRYSAAIRKGKARLRVKLPRKLRRLPLRVTIRYAGNAKLAPASQTILFGRFARAD